MLHSIIIPCYKSSQTIREVVELTSAELDRLGRPDYEFILVDDYSPDDGATLKELRSCCRLSFCKSNFFSKEFRTA